MEDNIEYILPFGSVSRRIEDSFFTQKLEALFSFRHKRTLQDIVLHQKYKSDKPLRILISGSHGLVGSALIPFLTTGGHFVSRLQRNPDYQSNTDLFWDPSKLKITASDLEGFDVIIHLGGVNIGLLWTKKRKRLIRESRIVSTRLLAQTIASLKNPPAVFITASASGYYGDRNDELLDENSQPGSGFLADLSQEWEAATLPSEEAGIRVVNLRFGLILSPDRGIMSKLIPVFKLGLGTVFGSGNQYWPWIAIDDVIGIIYHVIHTKSIRGPVNVVSPETVTNREFTKTFNRILKRPTLFSIPAWVLKAILGQMADEAFLASSRVDSSKLTRSEYSFQYPALEPALRFLLGKEK
jgi:uncharacterized protein (TIGR01777 family)